MFFTQLLQTPTPTPSPAKTHNILAFPDCKAAPGMQHVDTSTCPHLDPDAAVVKQSLVEECEQGVEDGTVGLEDLVNERNLGHSNTHDSSSINKHIRSSIAAAVVTVVVSITRQACPLSFIVASTVVTLPKGYTHVQACILPYLCCLPPLLRPLTVSTQLPQPGSPPSAPLYTPPTHTRPTHTVSTPTCASGR